MASKDEYPKHLTNIPYSDASSLNTLDVWLPKPPPSAGTNDTYWIIYVHGGAWRDPEIASSSFQAMHSNLQSSKRSSSIAGFASVNYRLSPYPSHPKSPSNPADPSRNAKHPDHITDVLTAILYLQSTYKFDSNYILVGHSVGATLAMQVAMKRYWGAQYESTFALELNVVPPVALVGLEGIYDILALVEHHKDQAVYRDFVTNAVAPKDWEAASPALWEDFEGSWEEGALVVLAHSPGDELVEEAQTKGMLQALEGQGFVLDARTGERRLRKVELKGGHDEVWETGEASDAVAVALGQLVPP